MKNERSLNELFPRERYPNFWFVNAAQVFLRNCCSPSIGNQLRSRKILEVAIGDNGGHALHPIDHGFMVIVDRRRQNYKSDAVTIAEELGRTFTYNLTKSPPECTLDFISNPRLARSVNTFCRIFRLRWLSINEEKRISDFNSEIVQSRFADSMA